MSCIQTKTFTLAVYAQGSPDSSKLALVIPGRLDTKDYAHMTAHVDYLASLGYYAVSFDPPGTWESPGSITLYTTPNIIQAIDEIIELFNNKPTFIMGHSRGGSIAMLAGTKNRHITHFAAVMSSQTPSVMNRDENSIKFSHRDLPPGIVRTSEQKEFAVPFSCFKDQQEYRAIEALKVCTKPKLFFYGTHDTLVEPEEVGELYRISADPKQIHKLNSEHDYRLRPEIIEEVNEVVGKFLIHF